MADSFKDKEKILKGAANHWRLKIMNLLRNEPELSLADIADKLNMNFKTASEHVRRLALPGLIIKRYEGNFVRHKLTANGESILKFLRI